MNAGLEKMELDTSFNRSHLCALCASAVNSDALLLGETGADGVGLVVLEAEHELEVLLFDRAG